MSAITGVAEDARAHARRAEQLRSQCAALAAAAQDDLSRANLAHIAERLAASVVRPLGSAAGSDGDGAEPTPSAQEADLAHQLNVLAVDATRLRVRAPGALGLQEATAALQGLACEAVADDVRMSAAELVRRHPLPLWRLRAQAVVRRLA